jgi:hypothetical protein
MSQRTRLYSQTKLSRPGVKATEIMAHLMTSEVFILTDFISQRDVTGPF